ncbi:MAG: biliverdin-producing heme oxygenase [Phycisphaerales bacterium]|nr:biliverdin-producing heme oxygenase [Phycisphaerales bacterium]
MITTNTNAAGLPHVVEIERDPRPAASLSMQLREDTADAHRAIERRPLQKHIAAGTVAPITLARYLAQLQRIHAAIETRLDELITHRPDLALLLDDHMYHSRRLDDDLRAIRAAHPSIDAPLAATDRTLQHLHDDAPPHALAIIGAHYVLEGSMNGNAFIVRGLRRSTDIVTQIGLSYFEPYGAAQRDRWTVFRLTLDAIDLAADERASILRAAAQMFEDLMFIGDDITG